MSIRRRLAALAPLLFIACGSDTPTSPSTTTAATAPVAPASIAEVYNSTLPVGGAKFYSFSVVAYGTVNVTLGSLTGPGVAEDATITLGLGRPAGTICSATTTASVSTATPAPQVTGTYAAGVYCVGVADTVGALPATASFSVAIEHS
jgi:hypothetical protein